MHDRALRTKQPASATGKKIQRGPLTGKRLTIRDLGWTREHAREVRAKLATFAVDWDDPSMDIYNGPLISAGNASNAFGTAPGLRPQHIQGGEVDFHRSALKGLGRLGQRRGQSLCPRP